MLQRMGEEGVHPREDTFNTLMEGALTAANPEMVPNLFKQLLGLRLRPDSLSYTSLITALSRLSRSEAAVSQLCRTRVLCICHPFRRDNFLGWSRVSYGLFAH